VNTNPDPAGPWRKSSYSNGQAECIEVAQAWPGTIAIRDSKDPAGPRLAFGPRPWRTFAAHFKDASRA
jgi:Domain of unknown function (DUF397)